MGEEYMRKLAADDAVVYSPITGISLFDHPEHAIEAIVNDPEWRRLYQAGQDATDEYKRTKKEIEDVLNSLARQGHPQSWELAELGDLRNKREDYDLLISRLWQLRVARGYDIRKSLPVDFTYPGMPT